MIISCVLELRHVLYLNLSASTFDLGVNKQTEVTILRKYWITKRKVMAQYYEMKELNNNDTRVYVCSQPESCICCRRTNVSLIKLENCSHDVFLKFYFCSRINFAEALVCCYCHGILRKIEEFKNQVERSIQPSNVPTLTPPLETALVDMTSVEPETSLSLDRPSVIMSPNSEIPTSLTPPSISTVPSLPTSPSISPIPTLPPTSTLSSSPTLLSLLASPPTTLPSTLPSSSTASLSSTSALPSTSTSTVPSTSTSELPAIITVPVVAIIVGNPNNPDENIIMNTDDVLIINDINIGHQQTAVPVLNAVNIESIEPGDKEMNSVNLQVDMSDLSLNEINTGAPYYEPFNEQLDVAAFNETNTDEPDWTDDVSRNHNENDYVNKQLSLDTDLDLDVPPLFNTEIIDPKFDCVTPYPEREMDYIEIEPPNVLTPSFAKQRMIEIDKVQQSERDMRLKTQTSTAHEEYLKRTHRCELCTGGFEDQNKLSNQMRNNDKSVPTNIVTRPTTKQQKLGVEKVFHSERDVRLERETLAAHEVYLKCAYRCELCVRGFESENRFNIHMKKHDKSTGDFVCDICQCVYEKMNEKKQHMENHYMRYKCLACNRIFSEEEKSLKHYNNTHVETDKTPLEVIDTSAETDIAYKCLECGLKFSTEEACISHYNNTHVEIDKTPLEEIDNSAETDIAYKCLECGLKFSTEEACISHYNNTHVETDKTLLEEIDNSAELDIAYKCLECGLNFSTEEACISHYNNTHVEIDKTPLELIDKSAESNIAYKCLECGLNFSTEEACISHYNNTHVEIDKTPLEEIDKSAETDIAYCPTDSEILPQYVESGSFEVFEPPRSKDGNEKPKYECKDCKKEYRTQRGYLIHLSTVHGIKMPAVLHYKQQYHRLLELNEYLSSVKKLEREKTINFFCDYCENGYVTKRGLLQHIMSHMKLQHVCKLCDMAFRCKMLLKKHMRQQHYSEWAGGPTLCEYCGICLQLDSSSRNGTRTHCERCLLQAVDTHSY